MSARAGEEIPKNKLEPTQSTPSSLSGSEVKKETGINWREVLDLSPRKVEETSYTQAKEQTQRKEAELSPEALDLAKDNFGELVYLLSKKPEFLKNNKVRNIIGQLSPELGKLFDPSSTTSLSADEVVRKIQREIGMIFTDDNSLSEQEKRIREAHQQQVVMIGLSFQEYKMQAITKACKISTNEEKPVLSTEEKQLTQNAKQKLRRPENVLVLDEDGRIIPQGPELSEEEFVNAHFEDQPVSFLNRILGRTEEVQRSKAAKEYQRYRKLLEEQEGEKSGERRLRFEIEILGETHPNGNQNQKGETQPKIDPDQEFLLRELGLMKKDSDNIIEAQKVLPEIMAQIRAVLILRQEILTATGISGEELFNALKNLSPKLPRIPSLNMLETDSLVTRIKEIIEQRQTENAKRVKEELEKTERRSTISQLEIKKSKLEERLREIKEKEAQEKGIEKETQAHEEGPSPETISQTIIHLLGKYNEELKRVELIKDNQEVNSLIDGNLLVMIKLLETQAKSYRQHREFTESQIKIRLEPLQRQLEYLRRLKAEAKKITLTNESGLTRVEEPNLAGINEEISKLENQIDSLWTSNGLNNISEALFKTEDKLAILQGIIESKIAIEGVTKTVGEWLELYQQRSSEGPSKADTDHYPDVDIKSTKEGVECELNAVKALIGYYSENALSEREERILQYKDQQPNYVFTNKHLKAIVSRNPELYKLLPKNNNNDKINTRKAKRVLLVLYQAFGDKFIYPDDPNAPEARGIITILQAIKDLGNITTVESFDEKMRELINGYLLGKITLGLKIERESTLPQPAPTETTSKAEGSKSQ